MRKTVPYCKQTSFNLGNPTKMNISLKQLLIFAVLCRLGLLLFGEWQDHNLTVKYTDVDYHVFTDAALYVSQGQSPYLRPTYRYSPLLSWLLVPCHQIHIIWGKVLFIVSDIATAVLIQSTMELQKSSKANEMCAVALWLFNPLTMTISSRGNAESIMSLLIIGTLYSLYKKRTVMSALLFSLSVHFKIFPAIYALPIYLFLGSGYDSCKAEISLKQLIPYKSKSLAYNLLKKVFSKERLLFFATSCVSFLIITCLCYFMYGYEFLEHAYFYHIKRKDIRHNFSVYFYMLYTSSDWWLGLLCFFNQLILVIFLSFCFYKDLCFCCFLLTYSFVTFNKVTTSQYFLWYLTLLPLLVNGVSEICKWEILVAVSSWFVAQSFWLVSAYALEFQAQSVFLAVWTTSLMFFVTNNAILVWFMRKYVSRPTFANNGQLNEFVATTKKLS